MVENASKSEVCRGSLSSRVQMVAIAICERRVITGTGLCCHNGGLSTELRFWTFKAKLQLGFPKIAKNQAKKRIQSRQNLILKYKEQIYNSIYHAPCLCNECKE